MNSRHVRNSLNKDKKCRERREEDIKENKRAREREKKREGRINIRMSEMKH